MNGASVINLDVRGLEPPIPMEKALDKVAHLNAGQALHLLIHREPFPLYELLDGMGYAHRTEAQDNGDYVVIIERRAGGR
jgi:uncharacterized protein (DUF2249 family)